MVIYTISKNIITDNLFFVYSKIESEVIFYVSKQDEQWEMVL